MEVESFRIHKQWQVLQANYDSNKLHSQESKAQVRTLQARFPPVSVFRNLLPSDLPSSSSSRLRQGRKPSQVEAGLSFWKMPSLPFRKTKAALFGLALYLTVSRTDGRLPGRLQGAQCSLRSPGPRAPRLWLELWPLRPGECGVVRGLFSSPRLTAAPLERTRHLAFCPSLCPKAQGHKPWGVGVDAPGASLRPGRPEAVGQRCKAVSANERSVTALRPALPPSSSSSSSVSLRGSAS